MTVPAASSATPVGVLNEAARSKPSAEPAVGGVPASVTTAALLATATLANVAVRSAWFPESARTTHPPPPPVLTAASPYGVENCADAPVPTALPAMPLPARVVTPPEPPPGEVDGVGVDVEDEEKKGV